MLSLFFFPSFYLSAVTKKEKKRVKDLAKVLLETTTSEERRKKPLVYVYVTRMSSIISVSDKAEKSHSLRRRKRRRISL